MSDRKEMPMKNSVACTGRSFLLRLALSAAMIFFLALASRAGGPKFVAGSAYFDPATTGQPLVWPGGQIIYYTDQGDLSPILPNASANTFVANAFSVWTGVPTAALESSSGGQLAEDVTGAAIVLNSNGVITAPADIAPSATSTPIGVVYDYDGSVTDVLLGGGAGDSSQCFSNAVYGGDDNYGTEAVFQHALLVINGQCALESSQLTDVEYRLLRVIGDVLGLGWSQLNANVQTGSPHPTSDDYAGFPLMHFTDPWNCVPITLCYPNPLQLAVDDTAAISRLYPVTTANQSNFPGKQVFSAVTARIHGSVSFSNPQGNPTQPMQGVNVVARWIDPSTGLPSRRYAASAVSGFLFTGNAGNPITGFTDPLGNPLAEWGSDSQTLEGFFDLAGLAPGSGTSAEYQLSIEPLNTQWSSGVGPYSPGPVAPSGSFAPVTVTVTAGNDAHQDILMTNSAQPLSESPQGTWTAPASVPAAGDWIGSLNGYGDSLYLLLPAHANRTLSVAVTAFNESGKASELKAQPVIGMWAASDPAGTPPPAFTSSPFNQVPFGLTRLDAQISTSTNFLVGISDLRGDGRPDYRYHAHILYGDAVSPARLSVNGGPLTLTGIGFAPGLGIAVGPSAATPFAISPGQMIVVAPPTGDGQQSVTITDPVSGSSSVMSGVLIFGAAASDNINQLTRVNPSTAVGTEAPNPAAVQVVAADDVTPVAGATVGWSATNGLQLSACGGASSCSVITDQSGYASTWMTPAAVGAATITATLAPGVYGTSKSQSTTLNGKEDASDIGVLMPYLSVSAGATASIPITARVLSNGAPQSNAQVNFAVVSGSGILSNGSAQTNSSGYATVTLSVSNLTTAVQVNSCVAPSNAPCVSSYLTPVPLAQQNLQPVAGTAQVSTTGAFNPLVVRVTDSSSPPIPVVAANVLFQTTVLRNAGSSSNPTMPIILKVSQSNIATDLNGLASVTPSSSGFSPPVEVNVAVSAGIAASEDYWFEVFPELPGASTPAAQSPVRHPSPVLPDDRAWR